MVTIDVFDTALLIDDRTARSLRLEWAAFAVGTGIARITAAAVTWWNTECGKDVHAMNVKQHHALALRDTDLQGALRRFSDDETLYENCLTMFLGDATMDELNRAVKEQSWDEAFTAAHALKGLAGNMGFVPLMHSTGQLVVLIRGGRIKEISECMALVNSKYRDITDAIRENFVSGTKEGAQA